MMHSCPKCKEEMHDIRVTLSKQTVARGVYPLGPHYTWNVRKGYWSKSGQLGKPIEVIVYHFTPKWRYIGEPCCLGPWLMDKRILTITDIEEIYLASLL